MKESGKYDITETSLIDNIVKLKNNDEFTQYLKSQCLKTTFNGIEVDSFAWYKKMLGIK